jgi:hypothetical protein
LYIHINKIANKNELLKECITDAGMTVTYESHKKRILGAGHLQQCFSKMPVHVPTKIWAPTELKKTNL